MNSLNALAPRDRAHKVAPRYLVYAARLVPPGILAQFFLAGLSMFQDAGVWEVHGTVGFLLLIPVAVVSVAPLLVASVRSLRWWGGILGALYVTQVAWMVAGQNTGSGMLQAMHVFNAGLLLLAALVIVAKLEKSHTG